MGYLIVNSLAVLVAANVVPGIAVADYFTAVVVAVMLGVVNVFLKPLLVFLTLPITILSLGLFIFVINALLVILVSKIVPGFRVEGFGAALLFSLLVTLVSWFLNALTR